MSYIGQTDDIPRRWRRHSKINHPEATHYYEVLCVTDNPDIANELECYFIMLYDTIHCGYNKQKGGVPKSIRNFSDAHRDNLSKSLTGRRLTDEHRLNMSIAIRKANAIRRGVF